MGPNRMTKTRLYEHLLKPEFRQYILDWAPGTTVIVSTKEMVWGCETQTAPARNDNAGPSTRGRRCLR
jgi:hypothetical protein